jgi:hypothetical protein
MKCALMLMLGLVLMLGPVRAGCPALRSKKGEWGEREGERERPGIDMYMYIEREIEIGSVWLQCQCQ